MKTRTTAKAIRNGFKYVIELPYCKLYNALHTRDANYYTCGIYGWNADVYVIDHETAIVTGYRPFGNIHPAYDLVKTFEDAENSVSDPDWETRNAKYNEILRDFVGTVKGTR